MNASISIWLDGTSSMHGPLPVGETKTASEKTPAEIGFDYCNQLFKLEEIYADLDADAWKANRLETEPAIWKAYWP